MAQYYIYRARTANNQLVTGKVQAASLESAKKILVRNHLTPLSVSIPKTVSDYLPFIDKVSLKEKTMFARQLSTMIDAGLTLAQALRLLIRQTPKGKFQTVLIGVLNDVQDGFNFSSALAKYPEIFDTIFINVIRAGEATGKLEVVLEQLATNMEKDVSVRGKIKGALFYPAFILAAMVGVAILMTTKVVPQLKDVFLSSGKQLPSSTTLLLRLSDYLINDWYIIIIGLVVVIVLVRIFLRSNTGIETVSRLSRKVPIAGSIIEESSMARFGRLLGMLLGSGVPLLEALRLINDSFTNRVYQRGIAEVAHQVERGIPMSVPIGENPAFPLMVGQMVSVGEQTGKMDEVLMRMANYFDDQVSTKVGSITTLIEPVVIVLLGLGVAWLVQAILLPIYQISSSVS
ncbi:type II secretion system F family protein [Patescibacteria group bacterium]|nr:type II secretion system F family protein [Patescibacteria group bacterium]